MGNAVESETRMSELELLELVNGPEEELVHWTCWDCKFDVCGYGTYDPGELDELETGDPSITCTVCQLMDELDKYKKTPCKHCGSELWAVPLANVPRYWYPMR